MWNFTYILTLSNYVLAACQIKRYISEHGMSISTSTKIIYIKQQKNEYTQFVAGAMSYMS